MSIDQAIRDDLQRIFKSKEFQTKVTEPTAEKLKNTIKSQSRKATDVRGVPFQSLKERHKKRKKKFNLSQVPDLHYKSRGGDGESKGAFSDGVFGYNPYGNEARFSFGGESRIERYMRDLQRGQGGMPQRKWFPDSSDGDDNGPTVQMSGKKVEEEVRKLFNKQRKIVVNG